MKSPKKPLPVVLVVDDETAIVEFVSYGLGQLGYTTLGANDSKSALAHVRAAGDKQPKLAIIDIAIGKESGLDLAHTLVAKIKNLRVLFISGYVNDMVMIDTLPNGTKTGFLQKVFSLDQLRNSVNTLLSA